MKYIILPVLALALSGCLDTPKDTPFGNVIGCNVVSPKDDPERVCIGRSGVWIYDPYADEWVTEEEYFNRPL